MLSVRVMETKHTEARDLALHNAARLSKLEQERGAVLALVHSTLSAEEKIGCIKGVLGALGDERAAAL